MVITGMILYGVTPADNSPDTLHGGLGDDLMGEHGGADFLYIADDNDRMNGGTDRNTINGNTISGAQNAAYTGSGVGSIIHVR